MLISHPRIYLDATGTLTDALLVRDGRVKAIGDAARAASSVSEQRLSPEGKCLFPALGDAHLHLWGFGLRAGTVDLRGLDADAALPAIADAKPQSGGWVFGANLDDNQFTKGQQIDRADLDQLFPEHPVCIHRVDRHALWANSAALTRANINKDYHPTGSGRADRNANGELTGHFVDDAMMPLLEAIPKPGLAGDRATFLESTNRLRDFGIGFCTVAYCSVAHLHMLEELAAKAPLSVDLDILVDGTDDDLQSVLDCGPIHCPDKNFRAAGIKFFADGALGSAGAHLLSPYRQGDRGLQMHPDGFLRQRIPELMNQGWQVAVHAIGDAAAREVLDAFEAVPSTQRTTLRPRLEHAQMVAPEDCSRFSELDVIASIQPIHLYSDAPWVEKRLQKDQLAHLFPWRSLLPATIAGGSDYPIDDLNPWHGIATALTRRGADGVLFRPEHALQRTEILAAYTSGAAFASHREDQLGSLHPGFRAAVVSLDTDPFQASPDEIWNTNSQMLEVLS